ncbi:MAG: N-acetylmuramic acid 6-phosphate etherase [Clostridia bacterium]|nr:N-acetylmuramic acid 6-phosphate etherase [Clostridia bacterium]
MNIPKTEQRNPLSMNMDSMSTEDMARLVICANYEAVRAAENAVESISAAVDEISKAFERGNKLVYIGAGTSGRLGVIDAAECPPTFGVSYDMVQGIIAGGKERMFSAGEAEEDVYENGRQSVDDHGVVGGDVVVGISAAGNAAFVVGALDRAKELGCVTVGICNNADTKVSKTADIPIFLDTGAEVLTGSTRLKAGTAQKIVLNTLTTCAMTKTGKVYENMMINLAPSNEKLKRRVVRIVSEITGLDSDASEKLLDASNWNIRDAIQKYNTEK